MDPLALLPYALAAAGGRLYSRGVTHDVTALVAAGVTLLQRSAPLVRALAGRRSAVLLRPGPAWIVALAASDGRGMVVLDLESVRADTRIDALHIGAVFTTSDLRETLPDGLPVVLLDEAPHRARVIAGDRDVTIDLGSHFGLDLAGDSAGPGSPEECLVFAETGRARTHAEVLAQARDAMAALKFTPMHHTAIVSGWYDLDALASTWLAPLLAGGTVST